MCNKCDKNTNLTKICTKCKEEKSLLLFSRDKTHADLHRSSCKACRKIIDSEYHKDNALKIIDRSCAFQKGVKNSIKEYVYYKICVHCGENKFRDNFNIDNKTKTGLSYNCRKCESKIRDNDIEKERRYNYNIIWRKNNLEKARLRTNKYHRNKRKNNIFFKLRESVSSSINRNLRKNKGSKNGESCMGYLPYSIKELKKHIESLWEPWMTWKNHGIYKLGGERKWHIDHIIPQSLLPYDSLDHPNFIKCWNLENLRPLEAMQNIKKGNK
jgi:hypothetical protein